MSREVSWQFYAWLLVNAVLVSLAYKPQWRTHDLTAHIASGENWQGRRRMASRRAWTPHLLSLSRISAIKRKELLVIDKSYLHCMTIYLSLQFNRDFWSLHINCIVLVLVSSIPVRLPPMWQMTSFLFYFLSNIFLILYSTKGHYSVPKKHTFFY